VSGNTLSFLSADGTPEFRTGAVLVKYQYVEPGYDGTFVKDSSVDIYDDDTPMVIVQTIDDGSVDVIEGGDIDQYQISLSKAPATGKTVTVAIDSVKTRATYGRTVHFVTQVNVTSSGDIDSDDLNTKLVFNDSDWSTPKLVTVSAIDDNFLDGNDTQVFAPDLQTVNKIRGPLIIEGAAGAGSLSLPRPLMLPSELNILPPDGFVQSFVPHGGAGSTETMTVRFADLDKVVKRLHDEEDSNITSIQDLVDRTLQLSQGPGTGIVLDPQRPDDKFDRFWLINKIVDLGNGSVELTLQNPSLVDPGSPSVTAPDATTTYAITSLSANFFADERDQVDYLFVFDDDSVANDKGTLTSSDGAVQGFTASGGSSETMIVETSALQSVLKLDGLTDVNALVNRRLEITVGPGLGRAWTISSIADADSGFKMLTLTKADAGGDAPTNRSEFRIQGGDTHGRITGFGMGPNVLFAGRPQPGGVTYGDIEVVQMSLGTGDDDVTVNYTTNAEDHTTKRTGDFYTLTMLDTGAGDDHVVVDLAEGDDGAFSLNLNAGVDWVDGSGSTLPLVVFGWDGKDHITGGSGDDILFGDRGRVDYVKTVNTDTNHDHVPDTLVDQIVTRLGHSVPLNPVNPPVTGATVNTLSDANTTFETAYGGLVGLGVQAISPQGHVQFRTIVANDEHTITVDRPWDEIPVFNNPMPDPVPQNNYYYRVSALPEDQTDGVFRGPRMLRSIDEEIGGDDTINAGAGKDTVIGGAGIDTISGGAADDWIAGDNARVDFQPVSGNDGPTQVRSIQTRRADIGSGDVLSGDAGADVLLGGAGGDAIYGDAAAPGANDLADIVIGDEGIVVFNGGYAGADADPSTLDLVQTTDAPGFGGGDTIYGNAGKDILIGGAGGDNVSGDADQDLILGDQGTVRLLGGKIAYVQDPGTPGDDWLTGGADPDLIIGGLGNDRISGLGGADILLGDEAEVFYGLGDGVTITKIDTNTLNPGAGGSDAIYGGTEDDIIAGGAGDDRLDGGDQQDLIFGDNVMLEGKAGSGDAIDPRYRALTGTRIYGPDGLAKVAGEFDLSVQPVPGGRPTWGADWAITLDQTPMANLVANQFGNDYIAGGAQNDQIFGQLGDDTIQGDGTVGPVAGTVPANFIMPSMSFSLAAGGVLSVNAPTAYGASRTDAGLSVSPSFEGLNDGDDYIEGNGGGDVIYGNLGQDDIVGGSSSLFSLGTAALRPDGRDLIFGGAGTEIGRDDIGKATVDAQGVITVAADGYARDADMILGDNGNIYRLVGVNGALGVGGTGVATSVGFLAFNYDGGSLKIIPRAAELLDYTPGGPDVTAFVEPDDIGVNPTTGVRDIGAGDELHGESGDDFIYGQLGSDKLFGDGQDDDIIGGYGNDWISGGTGDDGVIGDDGRIYTSRNGTAEPLNGVAATTQVAISTPGGFQQALTNPNSQLKKAVDLTPFSQDPFWNGNADEFNSVSKRRSDDIIYGGLGNDWLHGGTGDDAISGAEALQTFFDHPTNNGNALGYDPTTGEFANYSEFGLDALKLIDDFLLNFAQGEGQKLSYAGFADVYTDGDDKIFGDNGNDWLVGGTGRDDLYGGWGDDLMNADDDLTTHDRLNDQPDTNPSYEDRAYGGAGRDVLIANTGGDRLIDWVGEFNSYIVPFAPFGLGTVSRTLQPQLAEFLYALSASDGADFTRSADTGADPLRNGEPLGELGVVRQQDFAWQDQTGGPRDVQAGNIPGGKRDVLRSASFDGAQAQSTTAGGFVSASGFAPDSGKWAVENGALQVSATSLHGDAVSVFEIGDALPGYFEVQASVLAIKPTSGWNANSFLVFDYQNKTDFKFAGIDVSLNKLVMGHRDTSGWHVDEQAPVQGGVKSDTYYNMLLSVNGLNATLVVNNKMAFTHTFQPRVVDGFSYGLNWGLVGVGSNNSRGAFDNVQVQILPPQITFDQTEDFSDGLANLFTGYSSGAWSVGGGVYSSTSNGATGMSLLDLGPDHLNVASYLELSSTVNATGRAGFVFDRYADGTFKFVAIDAPADKVIIGHYTTKGGWVSDAVVSKTIDVGTNYLLGVALKGTTVSVTLNGQTVLGYAFNAATVDGNFGLLATGGTASFDVVRVKTNDAAFAAGGSGSLIAANSSDAVSGTTLTQAELDGVATVAISQWTEALGAGDARLAALAGVRIVIGDLAGSELGDTSGNIVLIDADAAGSGWFVDVSPASSSEFRVRLDRNILAAVPGSEAHGAMDLVTVVTHELGHLLGFNHADAGAIPVMRDELDPGVRYVLKMEANAPEAQSAAAPQGTFAAGVPFDIGAGMGGTNATVDWQAASTNDWKFKLSPYASDKPVKSASPNVVGFLVKLFNKDRGEAQSASYDSLGRELVGKDKGR
jgi:Ca2+-binding RTX toxin-like protein